jgi:hypothetical protein
MEEEVRNLMTRYGILEVKSAVEKICERIYADLKVMYERPAEEKKEQPPKRKYERKRTPAPEPAPEPTPEPILEPTPEPTPESTEKKRKLIKKANIIVEKAEASHQEYI